MILTTHIPILIVSYRNPTDVVECLEALRSLAENPAFDVYICENGGTAAFDALVFVLDRADGPCAGDAELVPLSEEMSRFVRVQSWQLRGRDARVLAAEARENFGYAGAINAWLRVLLSSPAWPGVWILNPDTQPDVLALAELVTWSSSRQKGMVGSRVVSFAEPDIVHTRGLRWRPIRASTEAVDFRTPAAIEPDHDEIEARLDAPSGTSIYVTRQCLECIGLMDERYFLYFEDLDWGYRAKNFGGIGYAHRSIVPHQGGTTMGSARSRSGASPFCVYLEFRNRFLFVRQHHRSWMAWTLLLLIVRSFEYGMVGAFVNMSAALRGLRAAMADETGRPDRVFSFHRGTPSLRNGAFGRVLAAAAKRRVKVVVSLVFHVIASVNRFLHRIAGWPVRHSLVVLCYHGVPAALRESFARQLDILAACASVIPADYHGVAVPGGRSVAITFDDAFTSALDNAIPQLRARRMPVTIFVPAGWLGCAPGWEMEYKSVDNGEIVATAEVLRALTSDLVRLGAHSLTHPHLSRISPQDACREITGCRERMRDIFGTDVRIFAFPYGDHDAASVDLCRKAGYTRVFTNTPSPIDPATDVFVWGRVAVDPSDGPLEFYLKMSGAYFWMGYVTAAKKWLRTQPRNLV
jgi:GT2 family glycosyltransferase/peptidoglycan/xylan/chitin deacetylase (PgdA/CDA1 family)